MNGSLLIVLKSVCLIYNVIITHAAQFMYLILNLCTGGFHSNNGLNECKQSLVTFLSWQLLPIISSEFGLIRICQEIYLISRILLLIGDGI